jgi:hypothetical protein
VNEVELIRLLQGWATWWTSAWRYRPQSTCMCASAKHLSVTPAGVEGGGVRVGPMLSPGASHATRVDVVLQQLVELSPLRSLQFHLLAYALRGGRVRSGHGGLGARPTVCFLHHQLVMCEAAVVQAAVVLVAWSALVLHHGTHGEQVVLSGRSCHQHVKVKVGCSCVGLVVLCGSLAPFFLIFSPHP